MIGADVAAGARPSDMTMGKRAMAVGQQAKAAVAAAREAGIDLPKNAQGMAASQIARGADPASVFEALVAPPDVSEVPSDPAASGSGDDGASDPTPGTDAGDGTGPGPTAGTDDGGAVASPDEGAAVADEGGETTPTGGDDGSGAAPSVSEPDPGYALNDGQTALDLLEDALEES